jgi:hypothetical protein
MRLALVVAVALSSSLAFAQKELSVPDANRIPVPQPQNVRVEHREDSMFIDWDITPLKRITGYEIFKKSRSDESPVQIATVRRPPYRVESDDSQNFDYFVVAIDYRKNRSKPSKVVGSEQQK